MGSCVTSWLQFKSQSHDSNFAKIPGFDVGAWGEAMISSAVPLSTIAHALEQRVHDAPARQHVPGCLNTLREKVGRPLPRGVGHVVCLLKKFKFVRYAERGCCSSIYRYNVY